MFTRQILSVENRETLVNTAKSGSLVWHLPMLLAINCKCLLLIKQKIQGVLKTLRNFLVDIDHKERARWCFIWRMGERCKQKNSSRRNKSSIDHWQLPSPSITENLSHVKLIFLSPNTTSVSQPMNQSRHNKMSQGPLQATISKADTGQSRF